MDQITDQTIPTKFDEISPDIFAIIFSFIPFKHHQRVNYTDPEQLNPLDRDAQLSLQHTCQNAIVGYRIYQGTDEELIEIFHQAKQDLARYEEEGIELVLDSPEPDPEILEE